jgi:3-methyladenine DNA glycosylase AlkD
MATNTAVLEVMHELALELWATGNAAARLLATLVCKPKAFSALELDSMVRDIRSPKLLDWFIVNVVKPGRHAEGLDLEALLDQIEKEMKQAPADESLSPKSVFILRACRSRAI